MIVRCTCEVPPAMRAPGADSSPAEGSPASMPAGPTRSTPATAASNRSSVIPSFISDAAVDATGPCRRPRCWSTSPRASSAVPAARSARLRAGVRCSSASRRLIEMPRAPMCPRSLVRVAIATPHPPCSGPTSARSGTWTSSRKTSSKAEPPVICRTGRTSMPGLAMSRRRNEIPRCGAASPSVLARRMPQSLTRPLLHHVFWPETVQPSPSRTARVVREARSLPAPGSLNSWHQTRSPRSVGPRCRARWASSPKARMAPPASTRPTMLRNGGTSALAASSSHTAWCSADSPRPPVPTGQCRPAHPASNSARCHDRASSASSGGTMAP
jgi:hypothetical protein